VVKERRCSSDPSDSHNVYLSGRNLPDVHVMRFADASAYEILWSETVVVEIGALDEGR